MHNMQVMYLYVTYIKHQSKTTCRYRNTHMTDDKSVCEESMSLNICI